MALKLANSSRAIIEFAIERIVFVQLGQKLVGDTVVPKQQDKYKIAARFSEIKL